MFKDKQSPGVCGVEAEVLLYAQSPSEALDTYICISVCCGCPNYSQCFDLLICRWGARGKGSVRRDKGTWSNGVSAQCSLCITSCAWTLNSTWRLIRFHQHKPYSRVKYKEDHEKNKIRESTDIWKKAPSDCCAVPIRSVFFFFLLLYSLYVIL